MQHSPLIFYTKPHQHALRKRLVTSMKEPTKTAKEIPRMILD